MHFEIFHEYFPLLVSLECFPDSVVNESFRFLFIKFSIILHFKMPWKSNMVIKISLHFSSSDERSLSVDYNHFISESGIGEILGGLMFPRN